MEYGLGEGILVSCQYYQEEKDTETFGPLPLNFFISAIKSSLFIIVDLDTNIL